MTPNAGTLSNIFSFTNLDDNFSRNHLQTFDPYTQIYRTGSMEIDPNMIGGSFHDDKSVSPTLAKTFRTIRKHFTRTNNNESEIENITEEIQRNFPKQTITTVTIKRSMPSNPTMGHFETNFPSNPSLHGGYAVEYSKEKSPKSPNEDLYHQTMTNKQGLSTTFTTYHTRTVTVRSKNGAHHRSSCFFSSFVLPVLNDSWISSSFLHVNDT